MMYARVTSDAVATSSIFTATSASRASTPSWHVGITPAFPSFLVLSNDAALERVFTDMPFLSVGLLGFGILTFLFVMHKFNLIAGAAFTSTITAFLAGILDIGQVLINGNETTSNKRISTALLITLETLLALSVGFRLLYFWGAVSLCPRGEPPIISQQNGVPGPSFLKLDNDACSGARRRWGLAGIFLKYALLLAIISISILQLLWRLVAEFSTFGSIYKADGILEVLVTAIFILKLFGSVWLSQVTSKLKIIQAYLPSILSLLIGMGVATGNILQFQFSETALGRFLQAIELYIIVLYILISSFYERHGHLSVSTQTQSNKSDVDRIMEGALRRTSFGDNVTDFPDTKISPSWSEGNSTPSVMAQPRMSTGRTLPSRQLGGLNGGSSERYGMRWSASRMPTQDMETGKPPTVGRNTRLAVSAEEAALIGKSAGWKDRALITRPLRRSGNTLPAFPGATVVSSRATEYKNLPHTPTVDEFDTSLYGNDWFSLRYNSQVSRMDSRRSTGQPLLLQEADAKKKVARLASSSVRSILNDAPIASKVEVSSGRNYNNLANFPQPPGSQMGDDDARVDMAGEAPANLAAATIPTRRFLPILETSTERPRSGLSSASFAPSYYPSVGTSTRTDASSILYRPL